MNLETGWEHKSDEEKEEEKGSSMGKSERSLQDELLALEEGGDMWEDADDGENEEAGEDDGLAEKKASRKNTQETLKPVKPMVGDFSIIVESPTEVGTPPTTSNKAREPREKDKQDNGSPKQVGPKPEKAEGDDKRVKEQPKAPPEPTKGKTKNTEPQKEEKKGKETQPAPPIPKESDAAEPNDAENEETKTQPVPPEPEASSLLARFWGTGTTRKAGDRESRVAPESWRRKGSLSPRRVDAINTAPKPGDASARKDSASTGRPGSPRTPSSSRTAHEPARKDSASKTFVETVKGRGWSPFGR